MSTAPVLPSPLAQVSHCGQLQSAALDVGVKGSNVGLITEQSKVGLLNLLPVDANAQIKKKKTNLTGVII